MRAANTTVCWLVHFPPEASVELQLLEAEVLVEAVEEAQVPLVMCGHTHHRGFRKINRTIFGIAGSATAAGGRSQSVNFYRVEDTGGRFEVEAREIPLALPPLQSLALGREVAGTF